MNTTLINTVNWFEIPATDIHRARQFYEHVFGIRMQEMTLANNLKMALFPVQQGGVGGALCEHPDFYKPGYEGPLVYLNANPDLQLVLNRVEENGGHVLMPKTQISPEHGHMAVIQDSEGNRVAMHSVQ